MIWSATCTGMLGDFVMGNMAGDFFLMGWIGMLMISIIII